MTTMSSDASPASEIEAEAVVAPTVEAPSTEASSDANTADSSGADTVDAKAAPSTLLDVLKAVVEPKVEAPEASSAPVVPGETEPVVAEAVPDADQTEANVPFHEHPRWKAVIAERDSLRPMAENYTKITDYMQANSLQAPEVAEGFEIMGLLKSNTPDNLSKVRDWFVDRLQYLNETLGHTLPADLQLKVDDGLIDLESAKELSRTRATATNLQARNDDQARLDGESAAARAAEANAQSMGSAVQNWENGIKAKDPDYATKKAELVEIEALATVQRIGRPPANETEALNLVAMSYEAVNKRLKGLIPAPRAMTPTPAGLSARATTTPATLREAVEAAVNR